MVGETAGGLEEDRGHHHLSRTTAGKLVTSILLPFSLVPPFSLYYLIRQVYVFSRLFLFSLQFSLQGVHKRAL